MASHQVQAPASPWRGAWFACSFLSRLAPGCEYSPGAVAASVAWFPAVGLCIGALQSLPFYLFDLSNLGDARGWLYAALGWWLTRGLHWDGLMDIADAWGANARGERFWEICKDSRVGAFAVLGALATMGLMASMANACLERGLLTPLVLAPMLGRMAAIPLACAARSRRWALVRPGMGATFLKSATPARCGLAVGWSLLFWLSLASFQSYLLSALLVILISWRLLRLGRVVGGVNGDFLGTAILLAEVAALSGVLLA